MCLSPLVYHTLRAPSMSLLHHTIILNTDFS
jgi:hypothetical protein